MNKRMLKFVLAELMKLRTDKYPEKVFRVESATSYSDGCADPQVHYEVVWADFRVKDHLREIMRDLKRPDDVFLVAKSFPSGHGGYHNQEAAEYQRDKVIEALRALIEEIKNILNESK